MLQNQGCFQFNDGGGNTPALKEFIASYLTPLICNRDHINPTVFVNLPAGMTEQQATLLLRSLNWGTIQSKIAQQYPHLSSKSTHLKMLPVAHNPLDAKDRQVKIHVMALTREPFEVEYNIEPIIAEPLKLLLPKTEPHT